MSTCTVKDWLPPRLDLYIDTNKVQQFEKLQKDDNWTDDNVICPLLKEFESAKENLIILNQHLDQYAKLNSPYFVFNKKGKYDFSSHAKEIHGNLRKKFFSIAQEVFINQSIDEINPVVLPAFISLSSIFLNALETNMGVESIRRALSKIKNFDTLKLLFGNEGQNIAHNKNYRIALKQAALNNPFFILHIISFSKQYHIENFGFTKKEIRDSMSRCMTSYKHQYAVTSNEGMAWSNFFRVLGHVDYKGTKWKVMLSKKEDFSIEDLPSEIVDFNKSLNLPRDPNIAPQKSDDGAEERIIDTFYRARINKIIDEKLSTKDRLLELVFHALRLQDDSSDKRARFCPKDCPYYGNHPILDFEYSEVKGFYRYLSKQKYFSLEKLIEHFYNKHISKLRIDGLSFHIKMSRSKNWVERLRNNFQEEEIIFKTCNKYWCNDFLFAEEKRFRDWLLTDKSDDTTRMYPNKGWRNIYIHDLNVHELSNKKHEEVYIKLLHLMIFEMERLDTLVNRREKAEES